MSVEIIDLKTSAMKLVPIPQMRLPWYGPHVQSGSSLFQTQGPEAGLGISAYKDRGPQRGSAFTSGLCERHHEGNDPWPPPPPQSEFGTPFTLW